MSLDLVALLAKTAAEYPDRPALADSTRELNYSRLLSEVERGSAVLSAHGIGPGSVVVVRLDPSADLVITLLAVLHAGACYLSLDPSAPPRRAELILTDARPRAIIERGDPVGDPTLAGGIVLRLRESARTVGLPDLAYIIYTSGTTGRPKGVPVTHDNVVTLLDATERLFDFTEQDRWLLFHSAAFDLSVWEIWGALRYGGRLFVADRWTIVDPYTVAQVVTEQRITVLTQTPTAFGALAPELLTQASEVALRYVIFAGERLRPRELRNWAAVFGMDRVRLINMYGITEITVHATFHQVTEADLAGSASIVGTALPGFTVRVRDEDGAPSTKGELLLAGPQVVRGYINRPELTDTRFLTDPDGTRFYRSGDIVEIDADGVLTYVGRTDDQVKIRGHRVELGEVEAAVGGLDGIASVCAFVTTTAAGVTVLACACTTEDGQPFVEQGTRARLRDRVPEYMIPAQWRWMAELPRNHNGKVDRDALASS